MAIVTFNPYRGLGAFSHEFNRLFDNELPPIRQEERNLAVPVDIEENDDAITLRADLPGMEKKAIKVNVDKGLLTISGERPQAEQDEKTGRLRQERAFGSFHRAFKLPETADESQIAAEYKNGVLTITLPKKEKAKPREIEVSIH